MAWLWPHIISKSLMVTHILDSFTVHILWVSLNCRTVYLCTSTVSNVIVMPKPKQLTVQCRLGVFQRFIYCCAISHVSNNLSHPLIGLCRFSLISMESGQGFSQCTTDDVTKPYDKPWTGIHVHSLSFSFFYICPWTLNSVSWLPLLYNYNFSLL